jgi:hypothetical protein
MRTVKILKKELKEAKSNLDKHVRSCQVCKYDFESTCPDYEFLLKQCEDLRAEMNNAEKIFQQELRERGLNR